MSKSRRLGDFRLARLAKYLVGTLKFSVGFDHEEYGDIVRILMDSDWAGSEERYSTHGGIEFNRGDIVDSCVASDQARVVSSGEEELYGIVHGPTRGIFTKHVYDEMGRLIKIDVETDFTAAIGLCY